MSPKVAASSPRKRSADPKHAAWVTCTIRSRYGSSSAWSCRARDRRRRGASTPRASTQMAVNQNMSRGIGREVVLGQLLERGQALLALAVEQVRQRQHGAPGDQRRVALDERLDRRHVLGQPVLAPAQREQLGGVDRVGVAGLRALPELVRLAREPLGLGHAPAHLRPHDLPAAREVPVAAAGAAARRAAPARRARRAPPPSTPPRAGRRCASGGPSASSSRTPIRSASARISSSSASRSSRCETCSSAACRLCSAATSASGSPIRRAISSAAAQREGALLGASAKCSESASRARTRTASGALLVAERVQRLLEQRDPVAVDDARLGVAAGEARARPRPAPPGRPSAAPASPPARTCPAPRGCPERASALPSASSSSQRARSARAAPRASSARR